MEDRYAFSGSESGSGSARNNMPSASSSEKEIENEANDHLRSRGGAESSKSFAEVDRIFEENDVRPGYDMLKKRYDAGEKSSDLLWRLAKYCDKMALQSADKGRKKELIFEGKSYALEAVQANENDFQALKWAAILTARSIDYLGAKQHAQEGAKLKELLDKALAMNSKDHVLIYLRGRFSYSVASLSWIERKFAAIFFGTPPTATMDEALVDLLAAEKEEPHWIENLFSIARTYHAKNDKENTRKYCEKCLACTPKNEDERGRQNEARKFVVSSWLSELNIVTQHKLSNHQCTVPQLTKSAAAYLGVEDEYAFSGSESGSGSARNNMPSASSSEKEIENEANDHPRSRGGTESSKSFAEVDRIFEENDRYDAGEKSSDLLWRLAKYCDKMALQSADKGRKKELIFEGKSYALEAVQANENDFQALKWAAILTARSSDYLGIKQRVQEGVKFKELLDKALAMNSKDHELVHLRGRFSYSVASLSWIERKFAAIFFATPPTATMDEALVDLLAVEKEEPFWIENLFSIALTYHAKNDKENTRKYCEKCLACTPKNEDERGRQNEARKLLDKC
ncbi:unnamed protein product [Cylicocyclus nassatus]|uniref:Regulator of microtubule dynamics protein 1 n=1 Tax=Cylicocyclus nassatus TaxID=53992 RepID=A0AA36DKZ2_CYLNA|nr:unnamed protein product [Cylicocyclus nassatus]